MHVFKRNNVQHSEQQRKNNYSLSKERAESFPPGQRMKSLFLCVCCNPSVSLLFLHRNRLRLPLVHVSARQCSVHPPPRRRSALLSYSSCSPQSAGGIGAAAAVSIVSIERPCWGAVKRQSEPYPSRVGGLYAK